MVKKLDALILSRFPELWSEPTAIRTITQSRVVPMMQGITATARKCRSMPADQMSTRLMIRCIHVMLGFGQRKVPMDEFFRKLLGSRTRAWRLIRVASPDPLQSVVGYPLPAGEKLGVIVDTIRRTSPNQPVSFHDRISIIAMLNRKDLEFILHQLRGRRVI